ncbi:MAG: glycoside hydrolase family 2 TIM barrel-domain containing protein [Clostridia bacterium]|nr:glycoside hydrolase family 2 TIM barrel-domain containing protein [Clostridia bacterium]
MREKILFDKTWLFHKGDIEVPEPAFKGPVYAMAKVERKKAGPGAFHYNSSYEDYAYDSAACIERWNFVDLPHDYIVEGTPTADRNNGLGFLEYQNAWYRKQFELSAEDKDRRISLYFEGVATHATIYVNGCLMGHNFCGYNSFEVDITDVARFGEKNVLAVYVETNEHEGWWYEGGGIYRHVWLCKTDLVHVDLYGVYVKPEKISDDTWSVNIETTVVNDGYKSSEVRALSEIVDADGNTVAICDGSGFADIRDNTVLKYATEVKDPKLWDIDSPYLYTVKTKIYKNGVLCDEYDTRTGFRTIYADPDKGFFLNGRRVLIKGVCAHQDCGFVGKAVPDNIHRYKAELVKEMGANGYRTSHYPHSEAMMDALDELGILVMDETRWYESTPEAKAQLEMLVKRDRNRPSVIMWSIGNEEPYHIKDQGRRIAENLSAFIRKLDDTRLVTTAVSNSPEKATVYGPLDIIGVNYNLQAYDNLHKTYPDKAIFSSECSASGTTRGWYEDDCRERGYLNAFDKDTTNWFLGREKTWKFVTEREWMMGVFQWIAFEHRGEAVWPRVCSQAGVIDLFLQKKDAFYQNQSHWLDRKMIHLMPHWNFEGREGELIRVGAYTNCGSARLYLNEKLIGEAEIEKYGHAEWLVPYEKGTLRVEGIENGEIICEDKKVTSGKPVNLMLHLDNRVDTANGKDIAVVSCICTDENGLEVPDAVCNVSFYTNKLGRVVGTGSDIADHTPVTSPDRRMRAGRAACAVLVGETAGDLKVYASAPGMRDAVLTVKLHD